MWQRAQTIYLILVVAVMAVVMNYDIVAFVAPQGGNVVQTMQAWHIVDTNDVAIAPSWPIGVLGLISILIASVSIFLFKNSVGRTFQIRLGILNVLILIGLIAYIGITSYLHCQATGLSFGVKFSLGLPLVAIILQLLAVRGVMRDEMLVRMSNRLR